MIKLFYSLYSDILKFKNEMNLKFNYVKYRTHLCWIMSLKEN